MNRMRTLTAIAAILSFSACSRDGRTYTLYRNSVVMENMRGHVATFDANEKEEYNRENCEVARDLFSAQPGVKTKFWCEKGVYRE